MMTYLKWYFRFAPFLAIAAILSGCTNPSGSSSKSDRADESSNAGFQARVAGVGVGQQGRSLDNESGAGRIIAGPAIAYFNARERIAFEIAVPHALNLYMASTGEYPRTHEEFMEKVVHANRIDLPKLPRNSQYRYHAEDHQLWVEPISDESTSPSP